LCLNIKNTILSIFLALVISFLFLIFITESYSQAQFGDEKNNISNQDLDFYSKIVEEKKEKIFLIGSSQIGRFNETHIQDFLRNRGEDYEVYNLAFSADTPKSRLDIIDEFLELKPSIIIYGIGYRDFADLKLLSELEKPDNILPNPERISTIIFTSIENNTKLDFKSLKSPKSITVKLLKNLIGQEENNASIIIRPNAPFYHIDESNQLILNDYELKRSMAVFPYKLDSIEPIGTNDYVKSLKEIINKIQSKGITLIIVTTPYSQYYLDEISEKNKIQFDLIINSLSNEYKISIYKFHNKFVNENIWNTNDHIAFGGSNILPNVELAKIISIQLMSNAI